jgi:hypothetical protein
MSDIATPALVDGESPELARVEAQMALLASGIRASTRSTAASIDPTLKPTPESSPRCSRWIAA